MDNLIALLKGDCPAALYTLETSISTDALAALSQEHNTRLFYLDGKTITNKSGFLQAIAAAMAFPDYFGQNWDALEDCLTDLDWLTDDRFILLYDQPETFAQSDPIEWLVALDILRSTVDYWRTNNRPLSILFKGTNTDLVGLEAL